MHPDCVGKVPALFSIRPWISSKHRPCLEYPSLLLFPGVACGEVGYFQAIPRPEGHADDASLKRSVCLPLPPTHAPARFGRSPLAYKLNASMNKRRLLRQLTVLGLLSVTPSVLNAQATHTADDWAQIPFAASERSSLRDFQARLRSALFLLKQHPTFDQPLPLSARVIAESRTGVRRLLIRNFQILSDGARDTAEFELGAGSWPSVVGALGSAVAGDYLTQAAIRGIPIDELDVVFTGRPGAARSRHSGTRVFYPQGLAYTVFIVSPASDVELQALQQTVERVSPALNLVREAQQIPQGERIHTPTAAERSEPTLAGLREFLEDKQAANRGAVPPEGRPAPAPQDGRPPLRAHIKVEGGTGIRHIRTDTRNFQVIHDYPRALAGHNLGPVPEEHLLGTLITCLGHIYQIEAAKRQIVLDTLELDVHGTLTTHLGNTDLPPRYTDLHYTVRIGSPESPERIEELQRIVESVCPIYNMLRDPQPIQGTLVRGPYSAEKEDAVSR